MHKSKRILLPVVVLVLGIATGVVLMSTGPKVEIRAPVQVLPVVEAMVVQPEDFQVRLASQGTVTPRTQSTLIPEVAGRITTISPQLRAGESFAAGTELFSIDPADYRNAITIARADLARAKLALEQEKALAKHALEDWEKLGRKEKPNDLTLRIPQVDSAKADVAAAEARLRQAERNLQRTRIRAPYAGRVLEKKVDLGQYVSPGTVAATIYAVDAAELRLPLTDAQLAFMDLPEQDRQGAAVTLKSRVSNRLHNWTGQLVRTEGAIDTASRQLFVVAQINKPFQRNGDTPALKIGQFVEAEISGHVLKNVFVLPRQAVESTGHVLVITADKKIERREVEVALRKGKHVIVSAGLQAGERISLTPMPFARNGTAISVLGEQKRDRKYPPLPAPSGH